MADRARITIKGKQYVIGGSPVTGDVAITEEGVSTIGTAKITSDMLSAALMVHLVPVMKIGTAVVGYCKIG